MNTPKWQKKLTKRELLHVKEWCSGTMKGLKANRKFQREHTRPSKPEPCWECRTIAKKTGD